MGCVGSHEHVRTIKQSDRNSPQYFPPPQRPKLRTPLPEPGIVAELPIIHPEQSNLELSNYSQRPQWEYNYPIREQEILPREIIKDQSAVNIIYSSDAHDPAKPKQVLKTHKLPFSLVILEEPAEASHSKGSPHSQKEQQVGQQPISQCTREEDFVPQRRAVIASSLQVKQVVSVVQDIGVFNQEKTIDVIGFDLRFMRVKITPRLQQ